MPTESSRTAFTRHIEATHCVPASSVATGASVHLSSADEFRNNAVDLGCPYPWAAITGHVRLSAPCVTVEPLFKSADRFDHALKTRHRPDDHSGHPLVISPQVASHTLAWG